MTFVVGGRAKIKGVQAHLELNGQMCTLVECLGDTGRWAVKLDGASSPLSLKAACLQVCDQPPEQLDASASANASAVLQSGSHVKVAGLQSRSDLNGRHGLALRFSPQTSRWEVVLAGPPYGAPHERFSLKTNNLEVIPFVFQVVEITGKGMGVVAISDLKRGQLILAEQPAFMMSAMEMLEAKMCGPEREEDTLVRKVKELASSDQEAFWSLSDGKQYNQAKSARGIFETNAIATGEAAMDTSNGLCLIGSRFNHSCQPNVLRVWKEDRGLEMFHAAVDIPFGTELCIYYKDVRAVRSERQASLRSDFNFVCCCEVCSLEGGVQVTSDRRRSELARLDEDISNGMQSPSEALAKVGRALEIIETEFAGNPWWSMRAHYDGFQWALASGDVAKAKSMMERAIACKVTCEGDYPGEEMSNYRKWASDPLLKLRAGA